MTLHDELIADGNELLSEVHGTPKGITYLPASGVEIPLDVISLGEVTVEDELVTVGESEKKKRIEKRSVKVSGFDSEGQPRRFDLNGHVLVAGDDTKWPIETLGGIGTSIVALRLKRPWQMEVGRSGRKQRG